MNVSTRGVLALGVGLLGVGCVVAPLLAQPQAPTGGQDANVKKSAATTTTAPVTAAKPAVLSVATVDVENVFKNYDKFKVQQEEFQASAIKKRQDLMKLQSEGQDEAAKLSKMVPNSVEAKKIEDHLTQLKAQIDATKEQAQRDFTLRETEMLAQTFKEVQAMIAALAQYKGLTYVMKVSSNPVSATNPDSVYAEMSKTILYSDPRNDLTAEVIRQLNARYKQQGGVAPKAATAAPKAVGTPPPDGAPSPRTPMP